MMVHLYTSIILYHYLLHRCQWDCKPRPNCSVSFVLSRWLAAFRTCAPWGEQERQWSINTHISYQNIKADSTCENLLGNKPNSDPDSLLQVTDVCKCSHLVIWSGCWRWFFWVVLIHQWINKGRASHWHHQWLIGLGVISCFTFRIETIRSGADNLDGVEEQQLLSNTHWHRLTVGRSLSDLTLLALVSGLHAKGEWALHLSILR